MRATTKQYQVRYRCHRDALSSGFVTGGVPVIHPTDALDNGRANVFDAGTGGGRQLRPDDPLVRGRCYFTVTKMPGVWSPPPGNSSRAVQGSKDCDPKGEWEGHLIYVPAAKDAGFAAWCGRMCGRGVVAPPARLELLYPPLAETRPDGTVVVPAGEDVLLALRGDWSEPEVEIWRDDVAALPVVDRLAVSAGEVLVIRDLPVGLHSVYAVEASQAFFQIELANSAELALPALSIHTVHRETGEELQGELHDLSGPLRWSGLLSGVEGWRAIDFPAGWPVEFSCRLRGEEQVRRDTATTPALLTELLGKCLAAEPLFARIDAGVFGTADWTAPAPVQPQALERRSIPRALRERLEWLLSTAVRHREGMGLPVGVRLLAGWECRVHPRDVSTVSKFLKVHRWPGPLIAHARAVAKDIRNHLSS